MYKVYLNKAIFLESNAKAENELISRLQNSCGFTFWILCCLKGHLKTTRSGTSGNWTFKKQSLSF